MELFFDTETSDMYKFKSSYDDPRQPWIVQLGFILSERDAIYQEGNLIINADGRKIASGAEAIHCISADTACDVGLPEVLVFEVFAHLMNIADLLVCHNTGFDIKVLHSNTCGIYDKRLTEHLLNPKNSYCTMLNGTSICKLPTKYGKYKWPKLQELHKFLFGEEFKDAHDALADVRATRRCYYEMTKE